MADEEKIIKKELDRLVALKKAEREESLQEKDVDYNDDFDDGDYNEPKKDYKKRKPKQVFEKTIEIKKLQESEASEEESERSEDEEIKEQQKEFNKFKDEERQKRRKPMKFTEKRVNILDKITPDARRYTRKILEELKLDAEFAKKVEEALYSKHKNPKDYLNALTKLTVYLDEKSIVGRFAKFFQEKVKQNIYTPERLIELTESEFLPEVFLKDSASESLKKDIIRYVDSQNELTIQSFNIIVNPTSSRKTKPIQKTIYTSFKDLESIAKDSVKELCHNPHWESRDATTILCKGIDPKSKKAKFYCLDVAELVTQIKENKKVTNKYTGEELPATIVNNIRKRYLNDAFVPAKINSEEVKRLYKTLNVYMSANLEIIETKGLNDNEELEKHLPPMIVETFESEYPQNAKKATEFLKKFIQDSMIELNTLISATNMSSNGEEIKDEEGNVIYAQEKPDLDVPEVPEGFEQNDEESEKMERDEDGGRDDDREEQEAEMKSGSDATSGTILENPIVQKMYNDYLNRLNTVLTIAKQKNNAELVVKTEVEIAKINKAKNSDRETKKIIKNKLAEIQTELKKKTGIKMAFSTDSKLEQLKKEANELLTVVA